MTESSDYEPVQIFIGVDVDKDTNHAVAINRSDNRLFDTELFNDETRLRSLKFDLKQHDQRQLVVDQPATIGALPVTVARSECVLVGYLPGLAMRHIADLPAVKPGQMLETLPSSPDSPCSATSMMFSPHKQCSPAPRIRSLLTQRHPALERVRVSRLVHPAVHNPLQQYTSSEKLVLPGKKKPAIRLCKLEPCLRKHLAADITLALIQ